MAQDLTLKVAGLFTDLNPLQEIPNGALKVADNIQIRRRGTAERRPGFPLKKNFSGISTRIERIAVFDGDYTVFGYNATVANSRWKTSADVDIVVDGSAANGAHKPGETHYAEMQKRLYVTLEDFVARYEDAGDTTATRAGIEQPGQPFITHLNQEEGVGWLALGDMVAWRAVLAKEIDGQDLLSAPSAPSYCMPTLAWGGDPDDDAGYWVRLVIALPPSAVAGDLLQIYRTPVAYAANFPTTPGDEMRLLASIAVTSSDVSNGYVVYEDKTNDEQLTGASLYTNATQQGILLANTRPERLGCIDTYSDMMFGGNVSTDSQLTLQMTGIQSGGDFDFGDPSRIWPARVISTTPTCTFAQNSPTISVAGWFGADFAAGQWITDVGGAYAVAGTYFQAGTKIQSVLNPSAGVWTITLDKNTQAFGGTPHTEFHCWFEPRTFSVTGQVWANAVDRIVYNEVRHGEPPPDWTGAYITFAGGDPAVTDLYFTANTIIESIEEQAFVQGYQLYWTNLSQPTLALYWEGLGADLHIPGAATLVGGAVGTAVSIPQNSTTFTITGTAARDAFAEGMYVTDFDGYYNIAGTVFQAETKISGLSFVSPTLTVTIDKQTNAFGATPVTQFAAWDWIGLSIGGGAVSPFFGVEKDWQGTTSGSTYTYDKSTLWSFQALAGQLGYLVVDYNVQAYGGGTDPRSWTFEAIDSSIGELTITSSKPQAWDKDVDKDTGVTSAGETHLNRLVWSKIQEPDAWPIGYFADIGQASARILRVMATRESLFVFKEDGTWRVTGTGPENLRIDEYDRTLKLMHPNAVSRVDNHLMGWFVSGVMLVTDAQTANVSDNMVGEAISEIREAPYSSPFPIGFDAFTVERDNQWHIVFGEDASAPVSLYVFNLVTQAWTTWTLDGDMNPICGVDDEPNGKILLGGNRVTGSTEAVWEEADPSDPQYDGLPVGSLAPVATVGDALGAGYTFTIAHTADPDLKAGDVFQINQLVPPVTAYFVVTEPDLTGAATVAWSTYNATIGNSGSLYRAPVASIEWTAKAQQNPGVRKFFREANLTFQRMDDTRVFDLKFSTDQVDDDEMNGTEFDDVGERPYAMRALIPTNAGRSFWLNPRIDIPYVFADFRLNGCSLVYEWMNERTGR